MRATGTPWRGWSTFLGHDDAKRVTPEDVVRFKDHRLASINPRTGKPISAKTVKDSDLSGLKTLFGWAVSNRKLTSNPATGITIKLGKPQKLRGKGLTEEEAKAILLGCPQGDPRWRVGGHLCSQAVGPMAGGLHWRAGRRACPAAASRTWPRRGAIGPSA